jgi:hypothetical protein
MATLTLTDGAVLADGRVVRLRFAVEPVPAAWGQPDWRPGFAEGTRLTLSTGGTCEFLGVLAADADYQCADMGTIAAQSGGLLPTGVYHVASALVETASGDEVAWSRVITFTLGTSGQVYQTQHLAGGRVPAGHTVNLYLSTAGSGPSGMRLYRSGITATIANLDVATWANDAQAFAPGRLHWWGAWLVPEDEVVTYADGATITATAPAGLLRDADGNATAALAGVTLANESLVDSTGFTDPNIPRGTGGVALYVSSTYGDDGRSFAAAQDPITPLATPLQAYNLLDANDQRGKGAAIRLLRGDTWITPGLTPQAGYRVRTVDGQDARHPCIVESYWHASFGTDPDTRPLIRVKVDAEGYENGFGPSGDYALVRGIHFRRADVDGSTGTGAPGGIGATGDYITFDDCVVERCGKNIDANATQKLTLLRTAVLDAFRADDAFSVGAIFGTSDDLLLSQCVFDRNGRKDAALLYAVTFVHSTYIHNTCWLPVAWGNLVREGGCNGLQSRAGMIAAYNVLSSNGYNGFLGNAGGTFRRNVSEKARHWTEPNLSQGNGGDGLQVTTGGGLELWEENVLAHDAERGIAVGLDGSIASGWRRVTLRNNTIVSPGQTAIGHTVSLSDPVPHRLTQSRNLIAAPAASIVLMPATLAEWSWYASDGNALSSGLPAGQWTTLGVTDLTLAAWATETDTEAASYAGAITLTDSAYDLGDYHGSLGGTATEAAYVTLLRDRPARTWGAAYDASRVWAAYAAAYAPTDVASPGEGTWDYYGAGDHREATPPTRRRFRGRRHV